ncbi:hypothetical protein ABZ639_23580 [Saccharomonospora sp. NPDC006951]
MTEDSDGGRPQKTVAELLAEHGGQVDGAPRRRRRRAADEDEGGFQPSISDTAPQAIIDRVRAEGPPTGQHPPVAPPPPPGPQGPGHEPRPPRGMPQPPRGTGTFQVPGAEDHGRQGPPPRQANGGGTGVHGPVGPPPPGPEAFDRGGATRRVAPVNPAVPVNPGPPPAGHGAPPPQEHGPAEGTLSARLDGAEAPPAPEPPPPARQRGFPLPPRLRRGGRGAPPPPPEPHTEQFPAVGETDAGQAGEGPPARLPADEPPAGLAGWRKRRQNAQLEDTQVTPPVPVEPPMPAQQGQLTDDAVDEGPPTGFFTPDFSDDEPTRHPFRSGVLDDDPLAEGHQGQAGPYADPYDDPYADSYDYADGYDSGYAEDAEGYDQDYDREYDDEYERGPRRTHTEDGVDADDAEDPDDAGGPDSAISAMDAVDDDEEDEEAGSPAKQWMALAGQLAAGVAGGAGVWLGFNWLWGQLPAAALAAALVVTIGLVWIVRKVRRAEDLQTTVLALLVGLVVTVSPAALLLVSR